MGDWACISMDEVMNIGCNGVVLCAIFITSLLRWSIRLVDGVQYYDLPPSHHSIPGSLHLLNILHRMTPDSGYCTSSFICHSFPTRAWHLSAVRRTAVAAAIDVFDSHWAGLWQRLTAPGRYTAFRGCWVALWMAQVCLCRSIGSVWSWLLSTAGGQLCSLANPDRGLGAKSNVGPSLWK